MFQQGDKVMVHSLGPATGDKEFRAIIRGIAIKDVTSIYIIEIVDQISSKYPFTHCVMPEVCLRRENWLY